MEPHIQKRHTHIHNQNGERHTLRVSSEVTDHHHDETDADTVDDSSKSAHRAGDIVGGHKAGAENHTTGKEVEERVRVGHRIDEPEDQRNKGNSSEDAERNPRLDDLPDKQVNKPKEQGNGRNLTGRASDVEE